MKAANIFHDLRNISSKDIITKTELLKLLKKYCKIISPYDLMLATAFPERRRKICSGQLS